MVPCFNITAPESLALRDALKFSYFKGFHNTSVEGIIDFTNKSAIARRGMTLGEINVNVAQNAVEISVYIIPTATICLH